MWMDGQSLRRWDSGCVLEASLERFNWGGGPAHSERRQHHALGWGLGWIKGVGEPTEEQNSPLLVSWAQIQHDQWPPTPRAWLPHHRRLYPQTMSPHKPSFFALPSLGVLPLSQIKKRRRLAFEGWRSLPSASCSYSCLLWFLAARSWAALLDCEFSARPLWPQTRSAETTSQKDLLFL